MQTKLVRVGLALGVLVLVAAPAASASLHQPSINKLTALQRGRAFYAGKTITFVTGSLGGGTDFTARALAPLLGSYLHATVLIENAGQAHGIPGQDGLAAASPTGLEIGYINTASIAQDIFTNTPGFNFNPGRLGWIVGQIGTPSALIASPSSAFTSFAALKSATTPARVLAEIPSQGTSGLEILFGLLGVHVQLVTGYASTSAIVAGYQRGDGPVATVPFTNAESFLQANQAKGIVMSVLPPKGTADRQYVLNTPTYAQLLKQYLKHPSKKQLADEQTLLFYIGLGQPIVTQSRVAADRLLALRAAAKWAYKQPAYISGALAGGSIPTYVDPVVAKTNFNTMLSNGKGITCYLLGTC